MDLFSLKWITCFWQTALTSKPSIWQICLHSKVELSLTTGWKIKPKKLTLSWLKVNFLGLNFQPVVRLSSTFECGQICQIDGLFAKAVCRKQVIHLSEKRSTWARILCICKKKNCPGKLIVSGFFLCVLMETHFTQKGRNSFHQGQNSFHQWQNSFHQRQNSFFETKKPTFLLSLAKFLAKSGTKSDKKSFKTP